jgi:hypothetical protein
MPLLLHAEQRQPDQPSHPGEGAVAVDAIEPMNRLYWWRNGWVGEQ